MAGVLFYFLRQDYMYEGAQRRREELEEKSGEMDEGERDMEWCIKEGRRKRKEEER